MEKVKNRVTTFIHLILKRVTEKAVLLVLKQKVTTTKLFG